MQIYYELNQKCKFTTLRQAYKIAICLTVCAILRYSKAWVLSISVSQIIQTFKCKVNIKCCLLNNMQPWHTLFLHSTSSVVQEHIIAAFTQVISSLHGVTNLLSITLHFTIIFVTATLTILETTMNFGSSWVIALSTLYTE